MGTSEACEAHDDQPPRKTRVSTTSFGALAPATQSPASYISSPGTQAIQPPVPLHHVPPVESMEQYQSQRSLAPHPDVATTIPHPPKTAQRKALLCRVTTIGPVVSCVFIRAAPGGPTHGRPWPEEASKFPPGVAFPGRATTCGRITYDKGFTISVVLQVTTRFAVRQDHAQFRFENHHRTASDAVR
jgi:hypothetical protein